MRFDAETAFWLMHQALHRSPATEPAADPRPIDEPVRALLESREVDALLLRLGAPAGPWTMLNRDVLELQLSAVVEFVDGLLASRVRPLVFKGIELISRYFRETPLGFLVDADVLVHRRDVQSAKKVLYELGYTQSYFDGETGKLVPRDVRDVGRLEAAHYELGPFCRSVVLEVSATDLPLIATRNAHPLYVVGDQCFVVLEVDVHHSVATDVDATPLLERAVPSTCCRGLTLSPTDHLWVNCSRFYNEVALFGKRSLRPLAYTAPLLTEEVIEWDILAEVARELELSASLYYPLRTLGALTGAEIPLDLLDAVSPRRGNRDLGWQLGALFGFVEPFPFGHHHQETQT